MSRHYDYFAPDGNLMTADITTPPQYDVSRDGQCLGRGIHYADPQPDVASEVKTIIATDGLPTAAPAALSVAVQNQHSKFRIVHEFRDSDSLAAEDALCISRWMGPAPQPN